jgi:hypothetical protein
MEEVFLDIARGRHSEAALDEAAPEMGR